MKEELSGINYENGFAVIYLTNDTVTEIDKYAPGMATEGKQPVIDFSQVSHVHSQTVGKVMGMWGAVSNANLGTLILRGMTQSQRRVFELAGIESVDSIRLEEAVDQEEV